MASLKPTIRQIRYFVTVAEALSFRGAAARLQVSQPTLSHQVLALEEAFGVQLFERSRAGTTLTPAARELLPNSRRVLEEFQGLCDQSQSVSCCPTSCPKFTNATRRSNSLCAKTRPVISKWVLARVSTT